MRQIAKILILIGLVHVSHVAMGSLADEVSAFEKLQALDWEGAIIAYERCLEEKKTPDLYYNLGVAYFRTFRFSSAEQAFRNAMLRSVDNAEFQVELHYNIGNALFRQAELFESMDKGKTIELLDQAIRSYEICIELNPDFKDAHFNLTVAQKVRASIQLTDESSVSNNQAPNNQEESRQEEESLDDQQGSSSSTGNPAAPSAPSGAPEDAPANQSDSAPMGGNAVQSLSKEDALLFLEKLERNEKHLNMSHGSPEKEDKPSLRPNW
jgi:tetratricopeptide (TPR) repeat protein